MVYGARQAPLNVPFPVFRTDYNNLEAARGILRAHGAEIAAVMVEPMLGAGGCIPATPEFLSMLREETQRCGALLVFDEVMSSRLAPGGLQRLRGMTPDLTTLGKFWGGGRLRCVRRSTPLDAAPGHAGWRAALARRHLQ